MWTEADLNKELKRVSHLVQNKGKPEEELFPQARVNLMVREFKANPLFTDASEITLSLDKYRAYLTNNELESDSDIDGLKSLIFNEVLESRIQKQFNDLAEEDKYPNERLIKSLVEVQNQKSILRIKLGIDSKDGAKDDLSALQLLQKRVDNYINNHKDEFTIGLGWECPKCNHKEFETFLLYKRTKDFDMIKHPFFSGRWLFNLPVIKYVKKGILTKEQGADILMGAGMSKEWQASNESKIWCIDYLEYCIENYTEIIDLLTKAKK